MPRQAGVWLRKGTPWWYTTIKGQQIRLSQDKKEAERLFHGLMAKLPEEEPEPVNVVGMTFRKLADEYLVATKDEKVERVFQQQVECLKCFCGYLKKKVQATDLQPHMVSGWLRTKKTWGQSTQSVKRKTIKAVLNWAVREGHLTDNPLRKMAGGESLKRDRILSEDEKKKIYEFVSLDFAEFLRAVELTGARPFSEMGQVAADAVDFVAGTITLQQHKNRKKTGKPRVIFVVPELLAILKKRVEQYPQGCLFRSRRGKPWYTGSSRKWFSEVEKKLKIKAHAYALRHGYITSALERGVPVEVVAALVGNTPQVVYKHYSHVGRDQSVMKAAALKAVS